MASPSTIDDLLAIMARLRDRERGCPWDVEQSFASIEVDNDNACTIIHALQIPA